MSPHHKSPITDRQFPLPSLAPHVKTRGAIAESLFTAMALSLGFMVSKPVLENSRYDLILDPCDLPSTHPPCGLSGQRPTTDGHHRLIRVQVKSAWTLTYGKHGRGRYQIATGCGPKFKRRYTTNDIDFLAAYLAPLEIAEGGAGLDRPPILGRSVVPGALARKGAAHVVPAAPGRKGGCKAAKLSPTPNGQRPKASHLSTTEACPERTRRNHRPTTKNIAASDLLRGSWYIIPVHEITNCLSLYFSPNPTTSRLMKYRDRWDLLLR